MSMEEQKTTMMLSKSLSMLSSKIKGGLPIEVGDTSNCWTDICNIGLFISLIITLMIVLSKLMRGRSIRILMQATSSLQIQMN